MNSIGASFQHGPQRPAVTPAKAVERFLKAMKKASGRTFEQWQAVLVEGIEECALPYDSRRAVLESHPLDDYYLAGAVALEASNIRALFTPPEAAELLGLIAENVDALAGRRDRMVSDLVFSIIGHLDLVTAGSQKMAYDQVVKVILQRLGVDQLEATAHLMGQALFRHALGEPLALGVPHWWSLFRARYSLALSAAPAFVAPGHSAASPDSAVAAKIPRRRPPRRATAF